MEIPRFDIHSVNPRLVTPDIGDAFQVFVHELLGPEHPGLHRFPGGGKDGGIDLIGNSNPCLVVECKVVGEDDYSEIEKRWNKVKGHLEDHLKDPSGPTVGQSQYWPWYSKDTPIGEYVFATSATFANENQMRSLRAKISDCFSSLATRHPHLSHLGKIEVSIIDWNDLCDHLKKRPHFVFRWFPKSRPDGLVPLDSEGDSGTFRAYLNNAQSPYHSIAEHIRSMPAPAGVIIQDEESLLARLERNSGVAGLVIYGKGGIGKSRLMLELGREALKKGWTVMRATGARLKDDALENLAERLSPDTPALLLVDYIETQSDFGGLIEILKELNDSGVTRIRYIAACRTGYYHKAVATFGSHEPVDLSPPPGPAVLEWFSHYRRETVRRILEKAGIQVTERHVALCHDLPILAVFLAYLHDRGRSEDLAELLTEMGFGQWVAKRVQLAFPGKDIGRELALLIALFPMTVAAAEKLHPERHRPVFDRIATDGWVEKVTAQTLDFIDEWVTAHDVLADQILLSFIKSIPYTVEAFVAELFANAADLGCLASAVVALQRIADHPPLSALPWAEIMSKAINANETAWRLLRDLLLRTTLLSVPEQIALLRSHKTIWDDADRDISFHNTLGWFSRWMVSNCGENIPKSHKQDIIAWVCQVAPFVEKFNFVITWGLRLAPESMKEVALNWIITRPNLLQTHYLMVAWLECGLPPQSIVLPVGRWCWKFSKTFHLSFLAKAWLDAKGELQIVREAIKSWLGDHQTDVEAEFVYQAWLDAKGEVQIVQEAIQNWLAVHKTDTEAQFVYKPWLDAKGELEVVRKAIQDWLVVHKTDAEASHVYKAWLDAKGELEMVRDAIQDWLAVHKIESEAGFVYKAWLNAKGELEIVRDAIQDWLAVHKTDAEAQFVYKAWLDAKGELEMVRNEIQDWLAIHKTKDEAGFVYKSWLDAKGEQEMVRKAITDWLGEHKTDAEAQFVYGAWLDAKGGLETVREAIQDWLAVYKTDAEASHVYRAWLDAKGEWETVREAIQDWLREFRTGEFAVYVIKYVAKQSDLPLETVRHILEWCRTFPENGDVLWRLTQLKKNLLTPGAEEDVVATSEAVLSKLIQPTSHPHSDARGQIVNLLSYLNTLAHKHSPSHRERVDALFVSWLRHPLSFGNEPKPHLGVQHFSYVRWLENLIRSGSLSPKDDYESLKRFMQWLDAWDIERKEFIKPNLNRLKI
ncbi:MAG: hypothetical protein NTX50_17845 [Candidatus Sumerlaeota bacterium]|nr:hypothetical protein [Candidatus Sumerlaeota bacterium]